MLKSILLLSTLSFLAVAAHAQSAATPTGQDVTVIHGNTSVTTHYDLVPKPEDGTSGIERLTIQTAESIKKAIDNHQKFIEAQRYIAQVDPGSMLAAQPDRIDDDGKISDFLEYCGVKNITPILLDRVRQEMANRHITRVWDLLDQP